MGGSAKTILIPMPAYSPGTRYGGPVRSVSMIASALGSRFRFRIITPNVDFGVHTTYPGIAPNVWVATEGASIKYLDRRGRGLRRLWSTIIEETPDLVYLNSVLHPEMSLLPLIARWVWDPLGRIPLLIAPRGELLEGALAIHSFKKRTFLVAARSLGLWRHCSWHATSQNEADAISKHTGARRSSIFVAPPITGMVTEAVPKEQYKATDSELRILFASRIARKKNLAFCLHVLSRTERRVHFSIAGPHEDLAYWKECQSYISSLPPQVNVHVLGELSREQMAGAYSTHDLLFLPTHSENFGHVIAEALLSGLPALISDQTYFRGLSEASAGWDLPLSDTQGWIKAIQTLADSSPEVRMRYRAGARAYSQTVLDANKAAAAMARVFDETIAAGEQKPAARR